MKTLLIAFAGARLELMLSARGPVDAMERRRVILLARGDE